MNYCLMITKRMWSGELILATIRATDTGCTRKLTAEEAAKWEDLMEKNGATPAVMQMPGMNKFTLIYHW